MTTLRQPGADRQPNIIASTTKSAYTIETANYRDSSSSTAASASIDYHPRQKKRLPDLSAASGMWNYNVGALFKPIPITSLYWGLRHVLGTGRRRA